MLVDQIIKSNLSVYLKSNEDVCEYFKLYHFEQIEVGNAASLNNVEDYFFKLSIKLDPHPGSKWTAKQLVELKVVLIQCGKKQSSSHVPQCSARKPQISSKICKICDMEQSPSTTE